MKTLILKMTVLLIATSLLGCFAEASERITTDNIEAVIEEQTTTHEAIMIYLIEKEF